MPHFATCAMVVQTFWPLMTHSSPSRTARVASDATSDPAPGSENIWHQISSHVNAGTQVALLLRVAAVGNHRRRHHPDAHEVAQHRVRRARAAQPIVDDLLMVRIDAEPSSPFGEVHPREAVVELRAEELLRVGLARWMVVQQLVDRVAHSVFHGPPLPPPTPGCPSATNVNGR